MNKLPLLVSIQLCVEVGIDFGLLSIDDDSHLVGTVEWSSKKDDTDLDHPVFIILIVFCVVCVILVIVLIKGQSKK